MMLPPRILLTLILAAWLLTCTSACNTVQGFGKDLEKAGEAVQNAAD